MGDEGGERMGEANVVGEVRREREREREQERETTTKS